MTSVATTCVECLISKVGWISFPPSLEKEDGLSLQVQWASSFPTGPDAVSAFLWFHSQLDI